MAINQRAWLAIHRAMRAPESWVVVADYTDSKGERSRRTFSPIRREGNNDLLVLCLASGEPRRLKSSKIDNIELKPASEVVIPEPKTAIP